MTDPANLAAIATNRTRSWPLALVPVLALGLGMALMWPRAAAPDSLPLPAIDQRALAETFAADERRGDAFAARGLSDDARALGSALRTLRTLQAERSPDVDARDKARLAVERGRARVLAKDGAEALRALRELERREFTAAFQRVLALPSAEQTRDPELNALGGHFVARMRSAGWLGDDGHSVLWPSELRVLHSLMWLADVGLDQEPSYELSLDERRVLYGLFLRAPHPNEVMAAALAGSRARMHGRAQCEQLAAQERKATHEWRVQKIDALGALDPQYPRSYALGVAQLQHGDHAAAATAFAHWLDEHPDGPYTLRARNQLRLAERELQR